MGGQNLVRIDYIDIQQSSALFKQRHDVIADLLHTFVGVCESGIEFQLDRAGIATPTLDAADTVRHRGQCAILPEAGMRIGSVVDRRIVGTAVRSSLDSLTEGDGIGPGEPAGDKLDAFPKAVHLINLRCIAFAEAFSPLVT